MRIGGIAGPVIRPPRRAAAHRPDTRQEPDSRALIAIEAPLPGDRSLSMRRHPSAPFLAQLIATQLKVPQTRARRRAEPEEATAAYRVSGPGPVTGRALRRMA